MLGSLLSDGILQKRQLLFLELWHPVCTIRMLLNVFESIYCAVWCSNQQNNTQQQWVSTRQKLSNSIKIDVKNRENWDDVLLLGVKSTWKMHKKVTLFKWCKINGKYIYLQFFRHVEISVRLTPTPASFSTTTTTEKESSTSSAQWARWREMKSISGANDTLYAIFPLFALSLSRTSKCTFSFNQHCWYHFDDWYMMSMNKF